LHAYVYVQVKGPFEAHSTFAFDVHFANWVCVVVKPQSETELIKSTRKGGQQKGAYTAIGISISGGGACSEIT
jgi:hypothetical protein